MNDNDKKRFEKYTNPIIDIIDDNIDKTIEQNKDRIQNIINNANSPNKKKVITDKNKFINSVIESEKVKK